jgi:hypothetical protein
MKITLFAENTSSTEHLQTFEKLPRGRSKLANEFIYLIPGVEHKDLFPSPRFSLMRLFPSSLWED